MGQLLIKKTTPWNGVQITIRCWTSSNIYSIKYNRWVLNKNPMRNCGANLRFNMSRAFGTHVVVLQLAATFLHILIEFSDVVDWFHGVVWQNILSVCDHACVTNKQNLLGFVIAVYYHPDLFNNCWTETHLLHHNGNRIHHITVYLKHMEIKLCFG